MSTFLIRCCGDWMGVVWITGDFLLGYMMLWMLFEVIWEFNVKCPIKNVK